VIPSQTAQTHNASTIIAWDGHGASAWIDGIGIHSGENTRVRFHRTPGEPIGLLRDGQRIALIAENVVDTNLATEIGAGGVRVSTIEHLLAALYVLNHWSGFQIEVDGPEVPILDGSAYGWAQALAHLEPEALPERLVPPEIAVEVRGGYVGLENIAPGQSAAVRVTIGYPHPAITAQVWHGAQDRWKTLLDARTFGFERDLERLWAMGRGMGVTAENAVVYGEEGPSLKPRGTDEPARHKALDLLGDLYLVGRPLEAVIVGERNGHAANVAMALELRQHRP
jgi:UDP-3-O-[3-hydroxymyristoyl] N-acetylglucosamine deacetylase